MKGIGLGFRRDMGYDLIDLKGQRPAFIELAPENWMKIGGAWGRMLDRAAEEYPIVCHGLSLSIGSPDPLDWNFLKDLKAFLKKYKVQLYSEHLSYSKCSNAHLYDLLPIPFRQDAVEHISDRIRQVQDYLEMPIALENVSYYTEVAAEMSEEAFISSIVEEAECNLLLDINNVYVNAFNQQYDSKNFLKALPLEKVAYIHMAGHEQVAPDLIIDTHGQPIIDPVYELFEWSLDFVHEVPVLLERDFNLPEMSELQSELNQLAAITERKWNKIHVA